MSSLKRAAIGFGTTGASEQFRLGKKAVGHFMKPVQAIQLERTEVPGMGDILGQSDLYQRLRTGALQEGPTKETLSDVSRQAGAAQGQFQQQLSRLASTGGLGSGARERAARQASLQGMLGRQKALRAGEATRQQTLRGLAGTEVGLAAQQSNLQAKLDAARQAAQAQLDLGAQQATRAKRGALFGLAGAGIGAGLGGPTGAQAGMGIGRSFGSLF